ncbi:MAG: serine/threonine-protein kinase [Polyangiaceae bacterium]|jgi:serine/threonine-protein kinase
MKSCPKCQRVFPNDAGFCPEDGTALTSASKSPVAPSDDDARIGAKLCGRYEIRRTVADGGMGRVYEAIDKQNDSRVALKILHDDVAKDDVALERFKREYEISALLPHEHIVRVLDFQRDPVSNTWVLVMEFLDGEELRYTLKRERMLPPERLVRMLSHVAIGMDEAHARGFIHRDLKPDNLFLCGTREGDTVKILDFGSVKDTGGNRKKLTVLGTTIGSPYYMAPEQAQGLETLNARADVFSLAALAYECVTGTVPFVGTNGPSILLAILTKDPDPPSTKAAVSKYRIPDELDGVFEQGLAKNPNIRTPTVGALADAIGHAYGLAGDHRLWAITSQRDLAQQIAEAPSDRAVSKVAPLAVAADPFARASPGSASLGEPQPTAPPRSDEVFVANPGDDAAPSGPAVAKPSWLLPLIVGLLALVVGGAVTLAVMGH